MGTKINLKNKYHNGFNPRDLFKMFFIENASGVDPAPHLEQGRIDMGETLPFVDMTI